MMIGFMCFILLFGVAIGATGMFFFLLIKGKKKTLFVGSDEKPEPKSNVIHMTDEREDRLAKSFTID